MNSILKLGEAKNKKMLLELGRDVTQEVIDRFEDGFFRYVKLKDIKNEILISIGKKIYSKPKVFIDYVRSSYEGDNFEWDDSVIDSYDSMANIVSCEMVNSGEYYFDDDSEMYLLVTDISQIKTEPRLTYLINEVKETSPLTIMLNKEEGDFILVLAKNKDYYILENRIHGLEDESIKREYMRTKDEDYVSLVDDINRLISKYKSQYAYRMWSDEETAKYFWEYMNSVEEFENIEQYLYQEKNQTLYNKLINGIISRLKDVEINNLNRIKNELSLYHNGKIDSLEDSYLELKELIWKSIDDNFKDEFISDENHIWKPINKIDKFKSDVNKRLNTLLYMYNFDLPCVLPKDIEYNIIKEYISNMVVPHIKYEDSEAIEHSNLEYFWKESEKYIDLFLTKGSLKNLTEDELNLMYSGALDYKDKESIREISIRYLREYFMNILVSKNDCENKLDLIALYYLILNDIDKIEPYIEDILSNGFTFKELENKVKNLNCSNSSIKQQVNREFKSIFNSYISKISNPKKICGIAFNDIQCEDGIEVYNIDDFEI